MGNNLNKVLKFMITLLDIQIEKAEKLVKIGIGPDAKLSAYLAAEVVEELLTALEALLGPLQQGRDEECAQRLYHCVQLMQFYLNCEWIRGHAGWLLDENRIHNGQYFRVKQQLQELGGIANLFDSWRLGVDIPAQNLSKKQRQHQYDSYAIAHCIFDIVLRVKQGAKIEELGMLNFGHGESIIRSHASSAEGRYREGGPILSEITEKHDEYQAIILVMQQDGYSKTQTTPAAGEAEKLKVLPGQRSRLNRCIKVVEDRLGSLDLTFYQVGKVPQESDQQASDPGVPAHRHLACVGLFALTTAVSTGIAAYFSYTKDSSQLGSGF